MLGEEVEVGGVNRGAFEQGIGAAQGIDMPFSRQKHPFPAAPERTPGAAPGG